MPLQEIIQQILTYLRGIWRYRWYAMGLAWAISVVGWIFIMTIPDEYEASARVHVDTESILQPFLRGLTIGDNATQRVGLMTKKLLTRPVLEKAARAADLDINAKTPQEMDALIRDLRSRVRILATKRNNLYTITATYSNANTAKSIVQSLVTEFMEDTIGDSRENNSAAQSFLRQQVDTYAEKLKSAEDAIKRFQQANMDKLSSTGKNYYQQYEAAARQLESARLELAELTQRRDELKRQLSAESPTLSSTQAQPVVDTTHPLDGRIQQLQAELNSLLLQYTEQHPKISALKDTLASLERRRAADLASRPKPKPVAVQAAENPVYQRIKIAIGETEAQMSSVSIRVREYKLRTAKLEKLANSAPDMEAKLKDLNRDYNLYKKNYDAFKDRLEKAILADQAKKTGEDVKFEVIEPPQVPSQPSGPNRTILSSGALSAGLIAGVLLAILLSQLRPTFYDQRTLRQVTGLPVFGTVSRIWTPQLLMKKRIEFGGFVSVAVLLVVVFVGVIFIGTSNSEFSDSIMHTVRSVQP